jgi:HEAT repeat protein
MDMHVPAQAETPRLLTDAQMRQFLANGYLVLQTALPKSFHDQIFQRFDDLIGDDRHENPGNNLLPLVPEINAVFEDAVVKGALTSVLGPDYIMHPHRALHKNPPGSPIQHFHKDSYWGYMRRVRNHRPRWVMIMYYPQDTPAELGPTGVVPGSHLLAAGIQDPDALERNGSGPAGSVLLIHYDIWHRKMKNLTPDKRFMMKFEFIRMAPVGEPDWQHADPAWQAADQAPSFAMEAVWKAQWRWLTGTTAAGGTADLDALRAALAGTPDEAAAAMSAVADLGAGAAALVPALLPWLDGDDEALQLDAAYALGAIGTAALPALLDRVSADTQRDPEDGKEKSDAGRLRPKDCIALSAGYGLVEIGLPAVPALLDLLKNGTDRARKLAAFALGEIAGTGTEVRDALIAVLDDADTHIRIAAVEALGLKPADDAIVAALARSLDDADAEVRFDAVLGLTRMGPAAAAAVPALGRVLTTDPNRYVRGYAVEALSRIGDDAALRVLVPYLRLSRWCPMTTSASIF